MSTDGSGAEESGVPLTRAQLRALRAAEEAAEPAIIDDEPADQEPADDQPADQEPADDQPADDEPAEPAAAPRSAAAVPVPTTPITVGLPASVPEQPPAAEVFVAAERGGSAPRGDRRFAVTLISVLGVLVLVVGVLGAVSLTQGPRIAQVQVDGQQAIETSGSRLILTANQRLEPVDAAQVTVQPAVPFTIDSAGRSIGIRFTVPLDDSTKYTVSVQGAAASGGGPTTELTTSFTTPASRILLLQRSVDGDDKIFTTSLSGERATAVFEHPHIDDYRATSNLLVVAVEEDDGSHLLVMNRDGSRQRELKLPGVGYVSSVQVSGRGNLVGYSYSDRDLTETSGRASVLVTQQLSGQGEPRIVQVKGEEASVGEWEFVPDSSSLLFIDFNGALGVEDASNDAGVQSMGIAASILGVSRGTYTAIVERSDGSIVQLDLTDGNESALPASDPDYGDADDIVPFPGGTLRHIVQRDGEGMPTGQAVVQVDDTGAASVITEVSGTDAILQTCVSPSGQYAAIVVAPDMPNNPYDTLQLPLPTTLHTQLIDLDEEGTLPTLSGFDISWCGQAPQ